MATESLQRIPFGEWIPTRFGAMSAPISVKGRKRVVVYVAACLKKGERIDAYILGAGLLPSPRRIVLNGVADREEVVAHEALIDLGDLGVDSIHVEWSRSGSGPASITTFAGLPLGDRR